MTRLQAAQLVENLPEILNGLRAGERFVLCEGEDPIATLVPYAYSEGSTASRPGGLAGDEVHSLAEEETDEEGFSRDLEEGIKQNAELLRRLAQ